MESSSGLVHPNGSPLRRYMICVKNEAAAGSKIRYSVLLLEEKQAKSIHLPVKPRQSTVREKAASIWALISDPGRQESGSWREGPRVSPESPIQAQWPPTPALPPSLVLAPPASLIHHPKDGLDRHHFYWTSIAISSESPLICHYFHLLFCILRSTVLLLLLGGWLYLDPPPHTHSSFKSLPYKHSFFFAISLRILIIQANL